MQVLANAHAHGWGTGYFLFADNITQGAVYHVDVLRGTVVCASIRG